MKHSKIKLSDIAKAELNEKELCRLLGGGGDYPCGCWDFFDDKGGNWLYNNMTESSGYLPPPIYDPNCGSGANGYSCLTNQTIMCADSNYCDPPFANYCFDGLNCF